ncbi:phosphoserine phosphatase [Vibrio sp. S4M6]|uniref:phosphoserine phosphatase n=1 Tax=Vibrio sinus TaxID=2946865 RepID=UPI002029F67D|nr:phosphoserine phosphatase [Vibrio sinus]MCL9781446.1 phosphoserine phosphatase [Vibrio sinus]
MDSLKNLPIKRHTSLISRFTGVRLPNVVQPNQARWIIFSESLPVEVMSKVNQASDFKHSMIDAWNVGHYEVALLDGELTRKTEHALQAMNLDYADLSDVPDLSSPGVIVFDMDSTVIQVECIDEIAKLAGVGEQVAEVTEKAMQGELDFEESLRARVKALTGADESILEQVCQTLPLMPDLVALTNTLKSFGWKTAIASGGFTYFSDHLKQLLDLDFAKSNQLDIANGKLTGRVVGEVVSAQTKAEILVQLAEQYGIEVQNTVAVGDGANDLDMMAVAGLGIAYHAKAKVEEQAQAAIRVSGLGGVMCILSAGLVKNNKVSWTS